MKKQESPGFSRGEHVNDDPLMLMAEYATDTPYHPIQCVVVVSGPVMLSSR